jgi:hypothetical protein
MRIERVVAVPCLLTQKVLAIKEIDLFDLKLPVDSLEGLKWENC